MRVVGAASCWLAGGLAYLCLEAIAAAAYPGYRYGNDFISDLGRPDSPLNYLMNIAFVVQGTMFVLAAVLLARAPRDGRRLFVGLAAANAVGNVVVAAIPSGSAGTSWLHVSAAAVAILGGNVAIVAGSPFVGSARGYRVTSIGLASVGLLGFVLLAGAAVTSTTMVLPTAVWERTSVYTIIGWQTLSAGVLLTRSRKIDRA